MNMYPTGLEQGKTKIPHGINFGKIDVYNATSYGAKEVLFADKKEEPKMYIDLEKPREEYKVMEDTEVHFGIFADFKVNGNYGNQKKHIDIYIPISELDHTIRCLTSIKKHLEHKTKKTKENVDWWIDI